MSITKNAPPCTTPNKTRSHYNRTWQRVIQPIGSEPSLTRQEFKNESDINQIMKKYQRTGALTHFAKYAPTYGDFSPCDLQTAQNLILNAEQLFAELPSSIRALTKNPEGFFAFVNDPANAATLVTLGLTKAPEPIVTPPPSTPAA